MKTVPAVKSAALSVAHLDVTNLDKELQETSVRYTLVMDFNALAIAQDLLHRDFASFDSWRVKDGDSFRILDSQEVTTLAWCAMQRFHPEVTLKELRECIPPGEHVPLYSMLLEMCFPGVTEAAQKVVEQRANGVDSGETQPNPQPAVQ